MNYPRNEELANLLYTNRVLLVNGVVSMIRELNATLNANQDYLENDSLQAIQDEINHLVRLRDQIIDLIVKNDAALCPTTAE